MKKRKLLIAAVLLTAVLMVLAVSCGGSKATEAAGAAPKGEVFKWRLQSWAPAGDATYEAAQKFAEIVATASGGRLEITPYTAGSIIPAGKEFDSVMSGSIEAIHGPPGWTIGYIPAAVFFTQYPGGLTANQLEMWMAYEGTGIAKELYRKLDVEYVGILTLSPAEVWTQSNRQLRSVNDIKGLKIRLGTTALNAIFQKMGATPVFLPGGEIYEAAQRGVIDALEYINPSLNWGMGFHEVTKYLYLDPSRAPCDTQCIYVNSKVWEKIPDDLKSIVKLATDVIARDYYQGTLAKDAGAVEDFKKYGTIVEKVPEDIVALLYEKSAEYFKEESAKDPVYADIYKKAMAWKKICEEFDVK